MFLSIEAKIIIQNLKNNIEDWKSHDYQSIYNIKMRVLLVGFKELHSHIYFLEDKHNGVDLELKVFDDFNYEKAYFNLWDRIWVALTAELRYGQEISRKNEIKKNKGEERQIRSREKLNHFLLQFGKV